MSQEHSDCTFFQVVVEHRVIPEDDNQPLVGLDALCSNAESRSFAIERDESARSARFVYPPGPPIAYLPLQDRSIQAQTADVVAGREGEPNLQLVRGNSLPLERNAYEVK